MNRFTREHYCFFVIRHVGTSTAQHARYSTTQHVTSQLAWHVVLVCSRFMGQNNVGFVIVRQWLKVANSETFAIGCC